MPIIFNFLDDIAHGFFYTGCAAEDHNLWAYSFPTLQRCHLCDKFLWGLMRQGLQCRGKQKLDYSEGLQCRGKQTLDYSEGLQCRGKVYWIIVRDYSVEVSCTGL